MDDTAQGFQSRGEVISPRPRLTSLSDPAHRRQIIVLLGMHRSGTSLCSNVLSILGVDMADDSTPGTGNERGHWERWEIVGFHDRILDAFNRAYLGPFHDFPLPSGWWAEPRVSQIRQETVAFLKARMGDAPFGFKDPRTIRLLPMWRQIFSEMKLSPKFILCLRNPAQVARSLHARDGLDPMVGEYRWLVHMTDFFRYVGSSDFCVIEYENWFKNPSQSLDVLQNHLNLDVGYSRFDLDQAIIDIVDPELRHDDDTGHEASVPLVRHVYQLARSSGTDAAARAKLHDLAAQFIGFDRLNRWFHRDYESLSAVAAKLPAAESEIANLRIATAESAAAGEEARARAAAADESVALLRAEMDAVAARLTEIEAERDAALARTADAEGASAEARVEIEAAHARLAEIEADRDAALVRTASAEQGTAIARAEIEAAHARLAEIVAERDATAGRAASLEQAVAEASAEAAHLRSRLAEVEHERNQALADAGAEIELMRAQIAEHEAEREASTARAVAVEAALAGARVEVDASTARLDELDAEHRTMTVLLEAANLEAEAAHAAAAETVRNLADVQARLASREAELFGVLQERAEADAEREHSRALVEQQVAESEAEAAEWRARAVRLEQDLSSMQALAEQRLASLDNAHSEAARAESRRAAETEELRREMAAVSAELSASRRMGAALLAALREPPEPVPAPPPRERWWGVIWRRPGWRIAKRG